MKNEENKEMLYKSSPAVSALNRVPGFDPLKLLRRANSAKTGEPVLRLDLAYKKLWFRLANPKGRIRVNALRLTEQMAVYEAQVFLSQDDPQPLVAFTASCTKESAPDGRYIEAAQREAVNEALTDAGYGLQFADVENRPQDRQYGSELPLAKAAELDKAVQAVQASPAAKAVPPTQPAPAPALQAAPRTETSPARANLIELPQQEMTKTPAPEQKPPAVQAAEVLVQAPEEPAGPAASEPPAAEPASLPYSMESPVEEILQHLTLEDALDYVVDYGSCNGWTLRRVSQERPASLKFYVYGGYKGKNNILRAGAKLVLESLTGQKAG